MNLRLSGSTDDTFTPSTAANLLTLCDSLPLKITLAPRHYKYKAARTFSSLPTTPQNARLGAESEEKLSWEVREKVSFSATTVAIYPPLPLPLPPHTVRVRDNLVVSGALLLTTVRYGYPSGKITELIVMTVRKLPSPSPSPRRRTTTFEPVKIRLKSRKPNGLKLSRIITVAPPVPSPGPMSPDSGATENKVFPFMKLPGGKYNLSFVSWHMT